MASSHRLDPAALALMLMDFARLERKRTGSGLSIGELERREELKSELNRLVSPGLDPANADRRRSVRVPTKLNCRFESLETFEQARITNLSSHGVFISTRTPLPVGTRLQVRIEIEQSEVDLEVPAVVVASGIGAADDSGRSGMGLRFSDVVPEMLHQLDELYQQALEERARELAEASGAPATGRDVAAEGEPAPSD